MLTTLSARETSELLGIMQDLTGNYDCRSLRQRVGDRLLGLLKADYFASFVWQPEDDGFSDCVSINMDPSNLGRYEAYYQFRDPITQKLQRRRRATHVHEVLPQDDLEKTEFYNDFLQSDGLRYGMNFHAHDGKTHVGDLRIWRANNRDTFDRRDVAMLQAVGTAFSNALCTARHFEQRLCALDPDARLASLADHWDLTQREGQILKCLISDGRDQKIAKRLGISVTTVRTHMKHLFQKANVNRRTELLSKVLGVKTQ
ncbi:MAG: helix-turn-helix transcriptional regulator [Roseibium sp.]|nr:helix-turn-helix transcriptional regulator [Roseibium sp.]